MAITFDQTDGAVAYQDGPPTGPADGIGGLMSPDPNDEQQLRREFAGPNKSLARDALTELEQRHRDRLLNHARWLNRFDPDPQTAGSDYNAGLMKAWIARTSHNPECRSAWAAWVERIIRNTWVDRLRRRGTHLKRLGPMGNSGTLASAAAPSASDPSREIERRDDVAVLEGCLGKLGDDLRRAFVMRYIDGLRFREIAERLGVSVATAKRWCDEAREQVAECFLRATEGRQ